MDEDEIKMAVIIQEMVLPKVSAYLQQEPHYRDG